MTNVNQQTIAEKIIAQIPNAEVRANDLTGTGDHWQVAVKAKEFAGLSMIEQHQLVYKALGSWVHKEIHALSLDTSVPD